MKMCLDAGENVAGTVVHERCSDYTFGAVTQGDGTVRFRLWAPGVDHASVELGDGRIEPMTACDHGFHEVQCVCATGTRYRYRVGPDLAVPDPASRRQNGDPGEASVVVDPAAYDWCHAGWRGRPWTETVLYEIHVGLAGGFRGVQERLADLADMGVTAIELMPVADFPGLRNWGYDAVLPYAPDCAYGTCDDLMLLIDTAHGMGLMVFLDVVYNHFGPSDNYIDTYAPDFFRGDIQTPWGPAIDFRQPQVRAFFSENALYWLRDYRFDGLRIDAAHAIGDPGWLVEMARFVRERIDPDRHIHLVLENDNNAASLLREGFDAQWNDDAHHILHHILTGETQGYYSAYAEDATAMLARCLGEGFAYQGEPTVWRQGKPRGEPSGDLAPSSFVFFLQNHDQIGNRALGDRLISLCKADSGSLRAAIALQLLTPHIPLLFMDEERGSTTPFQYFTSFHNADLARAVREGRRLEFAGFNEFSDFHARTRIPDPNDIQTWKNCHSEAGLHTRQSSLWRAWYGRLLHVRKQFVMPHLTGARSDSVQVLAPFCLVARWRLGNNDLLTIYCNLSGDDIDFPGEAPDAHVQVVFESRDGAGRALEFAQVLANSTIATCTSRSDQVHKHPLASEVP